MNCRHGFGKSGGSVIRINIYSENQHPRKARKRIKHISILEL